MRRPSTKPAYPPELIQTYFEKGRILHRYKLILESFAKNPAYTAIAEDLGIKLGTVKSGLNRARAAMDTAIKVDAEIALRAEERRADGR